DDIPTGIEYRQGSRGYREATTESDIPIPIQYRRGNRRGYRRLRYIDDTNTEQLPYSPISWRWCPQPGATDWCETVCALCFTSQKQTRSRYWCPFCDCGVHPGCYSALEHFRRPVGGGRRKRVVQQSESGSD
ncbi:hypothetical protein J6590_020024, partial [Homalodisca vitripennis]